MGSSLNGNTDAPKRCCATIIPDSSVVSKFLVVGRQGEGQTYECGESAPAVIASDSCSVIRDSIRPSHQIRQYFREQLKPIQLGGAWKQRPNPTGSCCSFIVSHATLPRRPVRCSWVVAQEILGGSIPACLRFALRVPSGISPGWFGIVVYLPVSLLCQIS